MATCQAALLTFSDTTMEIDAGYGRVAVGDAAISCRELLFRERSSTLSIRAPITGLVRAGTTSSFVNLVLMLFISPHFDAFWGTLQEYNRGPFIGTYNLLTAVMGVSAPLI